MPTDNNIMTWVGGVVTFRIFRVKWLRMEGRVTKIHKNRVSVRVQGEKKDVLVPKEYVIHIKEN